MERINGGGVATERIFGKGVQKCLCWGGEGGGGVNYATMQSYICRTAHLTFLVIADSLDDNGHLAIL